MKLHEMKSNPGSRKAVKRVGRGQGSGMGKTSSRGQKGQNSRSGGGVGIGFEGGQNPFYKMMPKRGFTNPDRKEYAIVNLTDLNRFRAGTTVTYELLKEEGVCKKPYDGLKVLGNGTLEKKINVKCNKISKSAQAAIEKMGGKVEVL